MADIRVEKRSCLSCKALRICRLFHDVQGPLSDCGGTIFNLYADGRTPGIFTDVYEAIGNACLEFKPRMEEVDNETE